jgi:hypothetical protein
VNERQSSSRASAVPGEWLARFPELPAYCGNEIDPGLVGGSDYRDWSQTPTTADQLRMEDYLAGFDLRDKRVLHIGIGNSGFAKRFHRRVRGIVGITVDAPEAEKAHSLGYANYESLLCNKYTGTLPSASLGRFDFILDNNPTSMCCCLHHFRRLLDFYRDHLDHRGQVVTDELGLASLADDPRIHGRFAFDFADLAAVVPAAGLEAVRAGGTAYVLVRPGEWSGDVGDLRQRRRYRAARWPTHVLRSFGWQVRSLWRSGRQLMRGPS